MQWSTLPQKLQRELFDDASAMGELLETVSLQGQIARFLHDTRLARTKSRRALFEDEGSATGCSR
jgi:hypothetical protein